MLHSTHYERTLNKKKLLAAIVAVVVPTIGIAYAEIIHNPQSVHRYHTLMAGWMYDRIDYITNPGRSPGQAEWEYGPSRLNCHVVNGDRVTVLERRPPAFRIRVDQGRASTGCVGWVESRIVHAVNYQEIFTTGQWGNDVPVFRDRDSFFNARDRNTIENVVCRLKRGHQVSFTPYRDWGVGEVVRENCKGWIDRSVIR